MDCVENDPHACGQPMSSAGDTSTCKTCGQKFRGPLPSAKTGARHPTIGQTKDLVLALFMNRTDKTGEPYARHLMRVFSMLPDGVNEEVEHAALLHDSMEDVGVTIDQLRELGYANSVIALVSILTHRHGDTYEGYLRGMAGNLNALAIKMADILDNADEARLGKIYDKDVAEVLRSKYRRALATVDSMIFDITNKPGVAQR